jgi:lipopolysaccharide biosynthesis glycosyltransferase
MNDTKNEQEIAVVCAADNNYAMPLAVTMRSALEHLATNRKIVLFIIDGGISVHNCRKILKSLKSDRCEVRWLPKPDDRLCGADILISGHITIATYYRLFIVELLPKGYKKVIYLDCDLVVKVDLGRLWDADIEDYYLLGVQDYKVPYVSSPLGLTNYRELGLSPDCKYFNAGVFALDLQKWQNDRLTEKAIKYIQEHKEHIRFWDQDVLNALLAGKWGELDLRWNHHGVLSAKEQEWLWQGSIFPEDISKYQHYQPYIIHYASYKKPWNTLEKSPRNDEFINYLDKTAWSGWRFTFWHWNWKRLLERIKRFRREFYLKLPFIKLTRVGI